MYRKAGVRRGVYFNPEYPHSVLTTVERGLVQFLSKFNNPGKPKNKAISTHKCMLENRLSLGSDNGEIEVATAANRCVDLWKVFFIELQ